MYVETSEWYPTKPKSVISKCRKEGTNDGCIAMQFYFGSMLSISSSFLIRLLFVLMGFEKTYTEHKMTDAPAKN